MNFLDPLEIGGGVAVFSQIREHVMIFQRQRVTMAQSRCQQGDRFRPLITPSCTLRNRRCHAEQAQKVLSGCTYGGFSSVGQRRRRLAPVGTKRPSVHPSSCWVLFCSVLYIFLTTRLVANESEKAGIAWSLHYSPGSGALAECKSGSTPKLGGHQQTTVEHAGRGHNTSGCHTVFS